MTAPSESRHSRSGYNPRTGAYHLYHEWEDDGALIETILRSVAAIRNLDPLDLDSPNETVDIDALNSIFRPQSGAPPRRSGYVSLSINDCDVIVHADGELEIYPPATDDPLRPSGGRSPDDW